MKSNLWYFNSSRLTATLAGVIWLAVSSVWAQEMSGTSTNTVRRPAGVAKSVLMDPAANGTVKTESLIVRSEPNWSSDELTHVHRGQTVTVFEQLTLSKPKANEPTNWARIGLPTNAAVWVSAEYVNTNTMTISARRINVRGGPSDNYTIICRLEKGAPVKEVRRTSDWIQIEPPTNAFGYVAAEYLTIEPGMAAPATTPTVAETIAPVTTTPATVTPVSTSPVTTPTNIVDTSTNNIATTATNIAGMTPANTAVNNIPTNAAPATESTAITAPDPITSVTPAATGTNTSIAPATTTPTTPAISAPTTTPAPTATPPATSTTTPVSVPADTSGTATKVRVITREGIVHRAINIQAPADFELRDINSGDTIEYVQPDPKDKNFKKYAGTHVLISGSEWVDRRWPKVPILKVETIDVLP